MKIGITRIRNEELIIQETLDHFGQWCDKIYVYDDASTDRTLEIVKRYPKIAGIIENKKWETDSVKRDWHEATSREAIYKLASKDADNDDWFCYFDADERLEFNPTILNKKELYYLRMRLFDFYITDKDKDREYNGDLTKLRDYCGPEFRDIIFWFRKKSNPQWERRDQREPRVSGLGDLKGLVRHYGKAISVKQWENICDYYSKYKGYKYKKWEKRKGKAIHIKSDNGSTLHTWDYIRELYKDLLDIK